MRILQIGGTYVSAQKKIEEGIHSYLKNCGHDSMILYAVGESKDKNIICYENKIQNLIRRGLRKIIGKNPHFSFWSTLSIIRKIRYTEPDVIHLHVIHHGYLDYILLFRYIARKNIPIVYTVHDMWSFTGGCYYYSNIECDGFKQGCKKCPKCKQELDCSPRDTSRYLNKKIELFNSVNKIKFVPVSHWVRNEMLQSKLSNVVGDTIWNAFDDFQYLPKNVSKKNDKFTIIGVAANWDDRKGITRFFDLAAILGNEYNILLVGNISDGKKNQAPDNIMFYGEILNKDELYKLYAQSDIHVSMSLEETFGLTFVEAALVGIKSIGFDSTAIPYVLEKTYGYIVPQNNIKEMVLLIQDLKEERDRCLLDEKQKKVVCEFFSSETMAKKYINLYKDLVENIR